MNLKKKFEYINSIKITTYHDCFHMLDGKDIFPFIEMHQEKKRKKKGKIEDKEVPARFELALLDSESNVLTTRLRDHSRPPQLQRL